MYSKVNGYVITPYDVDGRLCYAIRDGKVGNLIRNQNGVALIFGTRGVAKDVAESGEHCSKLVNFVLEM